MLRYFIAGNLWAFLAVVLILGREGWRTQPARYGFMGIQGAFSAASYNLIVAFCVTAATIFFLLAWKTHEKKPS
ncbi:MAG: hypothetical protein ACYTAS_04060 [Planctomycetota bacterium]|jgi:hypothetical protein